MISHNNYCIIDFETDSLDPEYNQPVSIGAVMIDGRKLTPCANGTFYSLISRIKDDEVEDYNLNKLEQKALEKNRLKIEDIDKAPPLKKVWADFINWFNFHNPSKDAWEAAILCGHNHNYDRTIINRIQHGHLKGVQISEKILGTTKLKKASNEELADLYRNIKQYKEPWKFGPDKFCYPSMSIDTYPLVHCLFENARDPNYLNLDAIKDYLGLKTEHVTHNALVDSVWAAEILVRYLNLLRKVHRDTNFSTGNKTLLPVADLINSHFKDAPF